MGLACISYLYISQVHRLAPQTRQLVEDLTGTFSPNGSTNGIVGTADPALRLKLDIGYEVEFRASHITMVSQLILHLAKQYSSCIHVGLGDDTRAHAISKRFSRIYWVNVLTIALPSLGPCLGPED